MKTLIALLIIAGAATVHAQYRHDGSYALPNARLTPGAANPALIADPSGKPHMVDGHEANLCAKDFRTGPWRKVSESEKKKACAEYGLTKCPDAKTIELDHLVSLEIGGSDALANLWPEPQPQARLKDHALEDRLPKLVCSGRISIKAAQSCISGDWAACMAKVKALEAK